MRDQVSTLIARFRERFFITLTRRIHWLTSDRLDLAGNVAEGFSWVLILGREHYQERAVRYPIRSLFDLRRVVRLETANDRDVLISVGAVVDDNREVRIYSMKGGVSHRLDRTLFIIPESLLISMSLEERAVATVIRDQVQYFVSGSTTSQMAGGLLKDASRYALAAGLPVERQIGVSGVDQFRSLFLRGLKALKSTAWPDFLSPNLRTRLAERWQPAFGLFAALVATYLLAATAYLYGMTAWRDYQLGQLGGEVRTLAETQRRIDRAAAKHKAVALVFNGRQDTYRLWEIAGLIWNEGGSFTIINLVGSKITIRGSIADATKLLKGLSKLPMIATAKFVAPVRQEAVGQEFVIEVQLQHQKSRG